MRVISKYIGKVRDELIRINRVSAQWYKLIVKVVVWDIFAAKSNQRLQVVAARVDQARKQTQVFCVRGRGADCYIVADAREDSENL